MAQLLTGYVVFSLSFIVIYMVLSLMLHIQFSVTGIVNFGIVGFWGLGMYSYALFTLNFGMPFIVALVLAAVVTGVVAWLLGKVILELDGQAVLVATLAFASIVEYLTTTEKWLTNGVRGLGTVTYPFDFGQYSLAIYLAGLIVLAALIFWYFAKLKKSPYGRLLLSINDNEVLARSIGKPTEKHKIILFVLTCVIIGVYGAFTAPVYNYLFPKMITSSVTFTIWIALMIGGRKHIFGPVIGVLVAVGIFDFGMETFLPIPSAYADIVPNIKYVIYGLALILVLMFRPLGVLGEEKRGKK